MIAQFTRIIWPKLKLYGRAVVSRALFIRDRSSLPLSDRNGEVITSR